MKHGSMKAVWLFVLGCVAILSASADELTEDWISVVLESFDGDTSHEYSVGRHKREYEFSWALDASKFASMIKDESGNDVQYPISQYIPAWPRYIAGFNEEQNPRNSFGIRGRFDRRGYNWIDVYPVQGEGSDAKPFEIPMPGRVRNLDLWVWGSNLEYYMEAYVRDYEGIVHILQLGNLAYTGWKNLRTVVPPAIHQSKRIQPNLAELHFIKFRIWTQPREQVSDFFIYLKQFKITTDAFVTPYDGDELADPNTVQQLWANSAN